MRLISLSHFYFSDLLSSDYMEIHYENDKPVLSRVRHKEHTLYLRISNGSLKITTT